MQQLFVDFVFLVLLCFLLSRVSCLVCVCVLGLAWASGCWMRRRGGEGSVFGRSRQHDSLTQNESNMKNGTKKALHSRN
jgi:hypothetical protein